MPVEMWTLLLLQIAYIYDAPFDPNAFMIEVTNALDDFLVDLSRRPTLTVDLTILEILTQALGSAHQKEWRKGIDPDNVMTIFNNVPMR
jgi:hypothetical protein